MAPPALGRSAGSETDEGSGEGDVWAQGRPGVPLPAVKPEPWGAWHTELPSSFQMQLPGQHCGLLCVPMRTGAPGPGCLHAEAEAEGQRDNELDHGWDLWAQCGSGGLHRPGAASEPTTAQRRGTQNTRGLWKSVLGVGAEPNLLSKGKSLPFLSEPQFPHTQEERVRTKCSLSNARLWVQKAKTETYRYKGLSSSVSWE